MGKKCEILGGPAEERSDGERSDGGRSDGWRSDGWSPCRLRVVSVGGGVERGFIPTPPLV